MAKSSKCASAHNEKTLLRILETLNHDEQEKILSILILMLSEEGFKPLIEIRRNKRCVYSGRSINVALPIYIKLLEQSIRRLENDLTLDFEFYAIDESGSIVLLGGA